MLRLLKAAGKLSPGCTKSVEEQRLLEGHDLVTLFESAGLEERLVGGAVVIIDGFPRNVDQLRAFDEAVRGPWQRGRR